jgi:hypothetical protein
MSRTDPDLHNAISLRPLPFSTPHASGSESSIRHHHHHHHHHHHTVEYKADKQPAAASATAVEAANDSISHDPVARPTYHRNSSDAGRNDVERQNSLPQYEAALDPYGLRGGFKDIDEEKKRAKANTKEKRSICAPVSSGKDQWRSKRIINFYEDQNDKIERLLTSVDDHVAQAKEEQGADALQFKIAVNGSFIANVILAVLQVYGAASSQSLSLFTTMADAIFDPCR